MCPCSLRMSLQPVDKDQAWPSSAQSVAEAALWAYSVVASAGSEMTEKPTVAIRGRLSPV